MNTETVKTITAKFGGTSNADGEQCMKTAQIIISDAEKRCIVVSAPGARTREDKKVTQILFEIATLITQKKEWDHAWDLIEQRYTDIVYGVQPQLPEFLKQLPEIKKSIMENPYEDFIVSRGEYMQALFMTKLLKALGQNASFVDTYQCIFFLANGSVDMLRTCDMIRSKIPTEGYVVFPGFYGQGIDGKVKAFSRGGSDLTGAIVAVAINSTYENWTDVDGFFTTNPSKVSGARLITKMTYTEVRILSYAGSQVLHPSTMPILSKHGINVFIKNTNHPSGIGTLIVPKMSTPNKGLVGVVGNTGFTVITVKKIGAHEEVGFGQKILEVFSGLGIPYEYELASGLDNSSFAIKTESLKPSDALDVLITHLINAVHPDDVYFQEGVGVINAISYSSTDFTDMLLVLERNKIKIMSQSYTNASGQIFITLHQKDVNHAVSVIHERFFH